MSETSINGIDVSECPLYDKKTGCYHTFDGECVKDSCTVHKWLLEHKRLQEENEELKEKCKKYDKINEQEIRHYAILTNENKKLTKVCQEFKDRYCELYENADQLTNKTYKYKKALEEIGEWATNHNPCDIKADINCTKEDCFKCLNYDIKKITRIIDEVIEDSEDENTKHI